MTSVALSAVASPLDDIRLGVVCPMANEAATAIDFVDAVLSECSRFPFRSITMFVIVDLVSRDETRRALDRHRVQQPELRVVWAPETRGVADAYVRGYREAIAAGCDWILEIDAGFSHDPRDIGAFVDAMTDGCDCVFGSRFIAGGRNRATRRRRLISRAGTRLTNALLGTRLTDMTSGFQLFTRPALELVLAGGIRSKGPYFQTEMKVHGRNLRIAEVPIRYHAGTHTVGIRAISESLDTLGRLFRMRLAGNL
jgi:dolichol-phosphate mannosyltransferase